MHHLLVQFENFSLKILHFISPIHVTCIQFPFIRSIDGLSGSGLNPQRDNFILCCGRNKTYVLNPKGPGRQALTSRTSRIHVHFFFVSVRRSF